MVQKNSIGFKPVILIGGATATGKSSFAISIAKKFNGEIISADSMQIYKDFNIGTAKITDAEMCGVPHHLLSFHDGKNYYSVAQFKQDAEKKIDEILAKGKLPIVVGGTGLYLNSILFNYQFGGKGRYQKGEKKYDFLAFVIEKPRDVLYNNINSRVDEMAKTGLIDEIKTLLRKGYNFDSVPFRAIGYKEFKDYFNEQTSFDDCLENLKKNTRHYAKRQITWFKQWKDVAIYLSSNDLGIATKAVQEFLKNGI